MRESKEFGTAIVASVASVLAAAATLTLFWLVLYNPMKVFLFLLGILGFAIVAAIWWAVYEYLT